MNPNNNEEKQEQQNSDLTISSSSLLVTHETIQQSLSLLQSNNNIKDKEGVVHFSTATITTTTGYNKLITSRTILVSVTSSLLPAT